MHLVPDPGLVPPEYEVDIILHLKSLWKIVFSAFSNRRSNLAPKKMKEKVADFLKSCTKLYMQKSFTLQTIT